MVSPFLVLCWRATVCEIRVKRAQKQLNTGYSIVLDDVKQATEERHRLYGINLLGKSCATEPVTLIMGKSSTGKLVNQIKS